MRTLVIVGTACFLALLAALPLSGDRLLMAAQPTTVRVSTDVTLVPAHPAMLVSPPSVASGVSASQAVQTALAEYRLAQTQVDSVAGAVRATISIRDHLARHHGMQMWLVTTDTNTSNPATGMGYNRLVIAVDVTTGKYVFAWPANA